jgi:hypothetical protein
MCIMRCGSRSLKPAVRASAENLMVRYLSRDTGANKGSVCREKYARLPFLTSLLFEHEKVAHPAKCVDEFCSEVHGSKRLLYVSASP